MMSFADDVKMSHKLARLIALSQVTRGVSILLVLNSAILFLYGTYKLIRFVIRYPRAQGGGGANDQVRDHAGA